MQEMLIVFREVLEASLIIGIIYTYLNKTNNNEYIKQMWNGVFSAISASVLLSILIYYIWGEFTGPFEKIFEATLMILASLLLGGMVVWMAKYSNIKGDLQESTEKYLGFSSGFGIFILSFVCVFREGAETVLFLYGTFIKQNSISTLMATSGGIIALILTYFMFYTGRKLSIKKIFNYSSVVLIFMASGMMAYGIHELEEAKILPFTGKAWNINPSVLIDGSYPLLHDKGLIGGLFKGLFGWNGDPSILEVFCYCITLALLMYIWNSVRMKKQSI